MATILDTLITDRTRADVDDLLAKLAAGLNPADHKGAYNASDLNRVGEAVNYLRLRLYEIGISAGPDCFVTERSLPEEPVEIAAWQEGFGEPAPDNVRAIHTDLTLEEIGPVWGGTLEQDTLTVTSGGYQWTGAETWILASGYSPPAFYCILSSAPKPISSNNGGFSHFPFARVSQSDGYGARVYVYSNTTRVIVRFPDSYSGKPQTAAEMKSWCLAQARNETPLQAVFTLDAPASYSLSDLQKEQAIQQLGSDSVALDPAWEAKTDWKTSDIPTAGQMTEYLAAVAEIRGEILDYRPGAGLPETMRQLDFAGANDIESLLKNAGEMVSGIRLSYRNYSGRLRAGVNCLP